MMDLDQAIDQSYREASDAEASARRLEARIEQIPAEKGLLPSRKYCNSVNFKEIQENLTFAILISWPKCVGKFSGSHELIGYG